MKKILKWVGIVVCVCIALYFMPFITTKVTDPNGQTWTVPFGSTFVSNENQTLVFSSYRSAYALGKDGANALHSYEEKDCFGTTYYYDGQNDISFSSVEVSSGFPQSKIQFSYEPGNVCQGWTVDDDVAWPYGKIEDVPETISIDQATEDAWLVIQGDEMMNGAVYNDFIRLTKQSQPSYMRLVWIQGSDTTIMDFQYLTDTSVSVTTRASDGTVTKESYAHISDTQIDGKRWLCGYQGSVADAKPIPLFPVSLTE